MRTRVKNHSTRVRSSIGTISSSQHRGAWYERHRRHTPSASCSPNVEARPQRWQLV